MKRGKTTNNDDANRVDDSEKNKKREKSAFRHLHDLTGTFAGRGRSAVTGVLTGGFKGVVHELPYRSLIMFLATFMVATVAGILVIPVGIAVSGSVWTVLVSIGFVAIILVVGCVVSLTNFVRGLITTLSTMLTSSRGGGSSVSLVGALFRGYFGGIIQVGCILLVFRFLLQEASSLFWIFMIYFIPIDVLGFTVPIPIPLGFSGMYIVIAVYVVATVILVGNFLMGGVELLQAIRDQVEEGGDGDAGGSLLHRSALYLLFLTLFPALNVFLCYKFIELYTPIVVRGIFGL